MVFIAHGPCPPWRPSKPTPASYLISPWGYSVGGDFCGQEDGIKASFSLPRDANPSSPMVSDELDLALQGSAPSSNPQPLQLTASHVTLHTCILADPSLSSHISKRQNAPGEVAGLRVHFDEGIRAHITVSIVGYVDRVASGALQKKGGRVVEWAHLCSSRSFSPESSSQLPLKDHSSFTGSGSSS